MTRVTALLQTTPAKRKGLAARQPDERDAAMEHDTADDGAAHGTAQGRGTDGQSDLDLEDEEPPAAASSPDGGLTFRTACRSGQTTQPTPHVVTPDLLPCYTPRCRSEAAELLSGVLHSVWLICVLSHVGLQSVMY